MFGSLREGVINGITRVRLIQFVPHLLDMTTCWGWVHGKQEGDLWATNGDMLLGHFQLPDDRIPGHPTFSSNLELNC